MYSYHQYLCVNGSYCTMLCLLLMRDLFFEDDWQDEHDDADNDIAGAVIEQCDSSFSKRRSVTY